MRNLKLLNIKQGAPILAALAAFSLGVSACGSSGGSNSGSGSGGSSGGGKTVKIAFMGALTGPNAQLGINIYDGAKLAFDQYNATNPSVKVVFGKYDTAGDKAQASALAPKVAQDKNVAAVGPAFSGESESAVPILEQAKIANISASATRASLSTHGWKFWHRVLANDDIQGPGVADFMAKNLKAKKVAVIDDQSDYGKPLTQAVSKELLKDGASVAVSASIDPNSDDYSSTVNKVKGVAPDAIFFGGYYSAASKLVKQLRDAGVKGKFVSGDGTLDPKFVEGAPQQSEGAFLSCTCVLATASKDPKVQKFIDDYKAAFKIDPGTYSAEGFDAATAFIKAIQAGKTSGPDINTYLGTEDFQGVSKHIKFDAKGELTVGTAYLHEVKGGKIVALGDYKTAKPQ